MVVKRQRRIPGAIVLIPLDDKWHNYARVLEEAMFAFYDCRTTDEVSIELVIASPILFYIPASRHAVTDGRWRVVGSVPLDFASLNPPPRFIQDPLNRDHFSIYENGKIRRATREECVGLEREAVWEPEHVEDRLRDHYAGRKNLWLESLKIRQ